MTPLRAALIAVVLLASAIVAVGGVLFLSLQGWPASPGTENIEFGARARLAMWALWVGALAVGVALAIALWRPVLPTTKTAAAASVAIGALAWTAVVAWAMLIEFQIYPTDPDAAAVAAPYATAARVLLGVAWFVGMLLAGLLFKHTRRSQR